MPIDDTATFQINVNTPPPPPSSARIQKMSICYSGRISNSTIKAYIAQHFDLVDTSPSSPTDIQWIKTNAVNPDFKAIGYFDAVFDATGHQEDWYVHKSGTTTRVTSAAVSSNLLMNPDPSKGWDNYYIQRAKTISSVYDGIFVDDCWHDPMYDTSYWSVSPSSWEVSNSNWKSFMVQFMGSLKTNLGSKIVMANTSLSTGSFAAICNQTHGAIIEHFVHKLESTDGGRSISDILSSINQLHTQAVNGDIIAAVSGYSGTNEDWCKFCYACFAFAVVDPTKSYFAWNFMGSSPTTNPTWYSWMDMVIGTPTDDYHAISGNIYERTFTNYYIIANLNNIGASVTFTFNGTSYTLEGRHALFIPR